MARAVRYVSALVLVTVCGLLGRFWLPAPEWIRDNIGGVLYVVFWILFAACLRPHWPGRGIAAGVFVATCAIEFLQLWHPAWLQALRKTLPGRLVLGSDFAWSDFPAYLAGALLGWAILKVLPTDSRRY